MADVAYVGSLAAELTRAEDDLQELRGFKSIVARFLNNQAVALDVRQHLAADLHLPAPEK